MLIAARPRQGPLRGLLQGSPSPLIGGAWSVMASSPALVFEDVVKTYPGGVAALGGASFTVPRGVLAGLVGPNGSGKTTSFRLAMGFARPTAGSVLTLGVDPWREERIRSRVGYLPERPVYPLEATVERLLVHGARLLGLGDPEGEARRWARVMGLLDRLNQPIGSLSRGYLQRLGLAYALLGEPELLLLDEPTANLDPQARLEILDLIKTLSEDLSATVVVSTHILPEMQRVANYLVILVRGRVVDHGPLGSLVERYRARGIYEVYTAPGASRRVASMLVLDEAVAGVEIVSGDRLLVKATPGMGLEKLLQRLEGEGLVAGYQLRTGSLEEIYMSVVAGS